MILANDLSTVLRQKTPNKALLTDEPFGFAAERQGVGWTTDRASADRMSIRHPVRQMRMGEQKGRAEYIDHCQESAPS